MVEYDIEGVEPAWCPGCGNFPILKTLKTTFERMQLKPHEVSMFSGIGQAAKTPHYFNANLFDGLHGRSIPAAIGAKIVNPKMVVIAESGDGDMYGEGGNHMMHAIRRNPNITVLVHNNQVYGLTKGQASPTSEPGFQSKIQTGGCQNTPVNPMTLALTLKAGFVARAFSGDQEHLSEIIEKAINFRGFALVDILMPCVTFNKINTFAWYKKRVYKLEDEGWETNNRCKAYGKASEWGERIPTGVIYSQQRSTYEELVPTLKKEKALIDRPRSPQRVKEIYKDFY